MNRVCTEGGELLLQNLYDNEEFFKEYAEMPRSREGLSGAGEWHQLKKLFPDLRGKQVLDLGCGYGWHCKYAVENGASHVLGIDGSRRMIQMAEERNGDPKICYQVCSLDEFSYPAEHFDCVISNLVLHYVEDLDWIYRRVYRTLKKGGCFLMNIEHPVFTGSIRQEWIRDSNGHPFCWPVDNYFYPGRRETVFLGKNVVKQHHTLTQLLNGLIIAGFRLDAVEEAVPPQEMMGLPGMLDELRRPMMLLVKGSKE